MKKIYGLLMIIAALNFQACEGPQGPPGIDGMDGKDGVDGEDGGLFLSTVFEAGIDFTEEDGYQATYDLEIFDGDNLLVFMAIGLDEEDNVAWMPLPQTFFAEQGMVIFNYFFTNKYFSIFMDSSVSPSELGPDWTDGQYFRIVVIPGEHYQEASSRIDLNDYYAVMKWLGKSEKDVEALTLR